MYLTDLYRNNRRLFFCVLIFCGLQLFFSVKELETTPFFLYQHYSQIFEPQPSYDRIIIKINGSEYDYTQLPYMTREMIILPLQHYRKLKENNFQDPLHPVVVKRLKDRISEDRFKCVNKLLTNDAEDAEEFRMWMRRYLEQVTGYSITDLEVTTGKFVFEDPGGVRLISEESLLKI